MSASFLQEPQVARPALDNMQADARTHYLVEWGVRESDYALVLHFFPPLNDQGKSETWPPGVPVDKALERALAQVFDVGRITAGYESEYSSFFVIAGGYGSSLNLRLLVKRLFDAVDQELEGASGKPSGTRR